MNWRLIALATLLGGLWVFTVVDIIATNAPGNQSVSYTELTAAYFKAPWLWILIAVTVGVLLGHLCWPQRIVVYVQAAPVQLGTLEQP